MKLARINCKARYDVTTNEIFIIGGSNGERKAIAECERFSILKRDSRIVQSLNYERYSCGMSIGPGPSGDTWIYAIGGFDSNGNCLKNIEALNIALGDLAKWEVIEDELPIGLSRIEAVY